MDSDSKPQGLSNGMFHLSYRYLPLISLSRELNINHHTCMSVTMDTCAYLRECCQCCPP